MPDEFDRIIAGFPFERVETAGEQALAVWERLKTSGRGFPVVVGDSEAVVRVMDSLISPPPGSPHATVAEILAAASAMRHPDDLRAKREAEYARWREATRKLYERRPNLSLPKNR